MRKFVFVCTLLLLVSCLSFTGFNGVEVKAPNGYPVHNLDTGFNYTSIQEAIDANVTLNGHTIFVEEGIYQENVIVGKSLTLIGKNARDTIIDGMRKSHVVHAIADSVKIMNFTITNSSRHIFPPRSGIYIDASNHCNVTRNEFRDNIDGISITNSFNTTICFNNLTRHDWTGIEVNGSSNNTIYENNIMENHGSGLRLENSYYNIISKNNLANNIRGIIQDNSSNNTVYQNNITTHSFTNAFGIQLTQSSNGNISRNHFVNCGIVVVDSFSNIIENNMVNSKPLVYLENVSNYTVQEAGQVIAVNCDYICVNNLNLSHATVGVELWKTNNSKIGNCNIRKNGLCGIILEESYYNILWGNNITENEEGMRLGWWEGSSGNNIISGNHVVNNTYGIYLGHSSNDNTISKNEIMENYWDGIYVYSSSLNVVMENNISGNTPGIYFMEASNNVVFHNNFINNKAPVYTSKSANLWDYGEPSEGNYWSNYTEVDSDHNGIGDSWHVISENNTDCYPLMGPFHSFNTTLGLPVNVISNSTIESFQHFESNSTIMITVSNMTANQTHGFCRISIPYEVMSEPFNVTVDGANPTYWNYTLYDNGTRRWIYFEYEHSTLEIVIIPEFQFLIILPLFMITTLVVSLLFRRSRKQNGTP